jgi:hypothetical protein
MPFSSDHHPPPTSRRPTCPWDLIHMRGQAEDSLSVFASYLCAITAPLSLLFSPMLSSLSSPPSMPPIVIRAGQRHRLNAQYVHHPLRARAAGHLDQKGFFLRVMGTIDRSLRSTSSHASTSRRTARAHCSSMTPSSPPTTLCLPRH